MKSICCNGQTSVFYTVVAALALPLFLQTGSAAAETANRQGHGHISVEYQYISVDGFEASTGTLDIGTTDTHSLYFEADYNLTEKLSISAGIPLVRKRYRGPFPHGTSGLNPPNNTAPFIDDGRYRTRFQDIHLGLRYLAKTGTIQVEPFVAIGIPSHDYPFFAHSAVGQNLLKLDLGTTLTYLPPLSDAFFRVSAAYVLVEETLGVSINHWRISGDAGYLFSPRFSGRVFFILKDGKGLTFPDDFPVPRIDEQWYQHDRLVKHNYMNVGIGADWAINENYTLSASLMTMTWAEQVHVMDFAGGVSLSWSF